MADITIAADLPKPTPYPDVNAILAVLLDEVRGVLGLGFVGLYLYGSLAGGGFDPDSSDIDFLVVTEEEVSADLFPALEEMHARIACSGLPWCDNLEGAYISRAALRRYDAANARHPTIWNDAPFQVAPHNPSWVLNRYLVREHGVTIAGPPPDTLIDPISADDLRAAVRELLVNRWVEEIRGPDWLTTPWSEELHGADWLRWRHYQAYAILTMCRALYLLETGNPAPKQTAAAWAQEHLELHWASLVANALAWRSEHVPGEMIEGDMSDTLAFICYTIERARELSLKEK